MTPTWEIRVGDALEQLKAMEAGSVQTCVTSPPYFGLRDYGTGEWEGGDDGCDHVDPKANKVFGNPEFNENRPSREQTKTAGYRDVCGKCGARRTDQQVGLEQSPDEYVARLVEVFREVRRVLRGDGTLWLNLGDSYAANRTYQVSQSMNGKTDTHREAQVASVPEGMKPKDLLGIPWAVAFALRADGWYLRSDIVWAKPNPMPESVTDRPTKAHEYLFLLAKSPRYFYDADAVREPADPESFNSERPETTGAAIKAAYGYDGIARTTPQGRTCGVHASGGRNKRSVWTVATQPFSQAHFAVFPPKLIEPCVLAGSSPRACGVCGAPWERVTEVVGYDRQRWAPGEDQYHTQAKGKHGSTSSFTTGDVAVRQTKGFEPGCDCLDPDDRFDRAGTGKSVVLDPFSGAGTTGLVSVQHGRSFIGIELNPAYAEMARERIATAERLGFRSPQAGPDQIAGQLDLLGDTA